MTFLNATLMFGIAAIAAPIAVHLLNKREPRKVIFPSVQFLTGRFEANRSRLQVKRWWLLALRIGALAALAVALAQPVIHRSLSLTWLTIALLAAVAVVMVIMASVALVRGVSKTTGYALGGGALLLLLTAALWSLGTAASGPAMSLDRAQPVAVAVVLDNGPTAAWNAADDDRMARMKDLATWMITRLPPSSRVAVIDRSGKLASFAMDISSALAAIEQLQPLELTQPIAARLQAAARLLRTSELPDRQLLVITDLAQSTWESALDDASLAPTLTGEPALALTVLDLGPPVGRNRSLTVPRLADPTPPRGATVPVTSTVSVSGIGTDREISAIAELEVYENDPSLPVVRDAAVVPPPIRSVDRTSVKLAAGEPREVLLNLPLLEVGTHHGRIRLVGEDAMPLDDVRYFTLQVLPPSRLLLVGDDVQEARVIAQTIAPSGGGGEERPSNEFLVERIGYTDLAVVRLEDFPGVILLDPPREVLRDTALADYVGGGGGLLVALGPAAGEPPLSESVVPPLIRRWRSPQPGTFFQIVNPSHPVTEPLATDTPWTDFRIHQYWQIRPPEGAEVLMRYAGTEHAAVTAQRVNAAGGTSGRILTITTPVPALGQSTRRWNDLYGTDPWPAWLLMRLGVEYLTGRGAAARMSAVGQPIVVSIGADGGPAETPERLQLFPPAGRLPIPLEVPPGGQPLVINTVAQAGTYWIRGLGTGAGFSANLPEQSLSAERIEPGQLDQVFGADRYVLTTSREGIEIAESKTADQVPLQAPAMLLALAVFLLEQILSNRFYGQPKSTPGTAFSLRGAPAGKPT